MRLDALLRQTTVHSEHGSREAEISGLCVDSRQAKPGILFVALAGARLKGEDFIAEAVSRGAAAVVAERADVLSGGSGVTLVVVADARRALAELAGAYYERPSEK